MANPLIGSRISLISKKNIRYEGTLYSINEADATVALQNVKSYGTEGREQTDPSGTFVPAQDTVHPYLVFRGSDIKDLHVHERIPDPPPPPVPPAPNVTVLPKPADLPIPSGASEPFAIPDPPKNQEISKPAFNDASEPANTKGEDPKNLSKRQPRPRRNNTNIQHAVGTGASLLTRKERGASNLNSMLTPADDFDFESNLAHFEKEVSDDNDGDEYANDSAHAETTAYEKDDFFDSISCDALDKEKGRDNRLRGADERNLNTETFGAIALNGYRRYNGRGRGRGGGTGRGRGEGRGEGRGDGRGRGRSGRGRGRGNGNGRGRSRYHGDGNLPPQNKPVSAS